MLTSTRRLASRSRFPAAKIAPTLVCGRVGNNSDVTLSHSPRLDSGKSPTNYLVTRDFSAATKKWNNDPSYVDIKFKTLVDLIENACKTYSTRDIFGVRNGDKFDYITYKQFHELYSNTRTVLSHFGDVGFGDKVAMISNNRIEWASSYYATVSLGAQLVPMYEAQLEKDWKFIIEDSEAKVIVCANLRIYDIVKEYIGKVGKVQHVFVFDVPEGTPGGDRISYNALLAKVADPSQGIATVPANTHVTPENISTIIYTSGTTGQPKGVELSHNNIISDILGAKLILKDYLEANRSLAFLPWAHVFGMTSELHSLISTGSCLAIVPSREQIVECIGMVKPTIMLSVPVLFNKVYDGVMKNISKQSPLKQGLFNYALRVARKRNQRMEFGKSVPFILSLQHSLFDKIVFSKIREKLGGNLRGMASGGAAASPKVLEFFEDIGIPIMEGYGLTETAPMITIGSADFSKRRIGCVGVPLPNVDVRIIDPDSKQEMPPNTDGEIVCSGPNVMVGYRNNAAANDEVFFHHSYNRNNEKVMRYFRTGDMGRMVDGKFLKITGRIKEQFKLENGKYVVPAPLEDVFARGPFISQCFLYGANMPHTTLLIVPNYVELYNYAIENKKEEFAKLIPYKTLAEVQSAGSAGHPLIMENSIHTPLFQSEEFIRIITEEITRHSDNVKGFEKPSIWMPLLNPFSTENQMLTPKLSLRRKNILVPYQRLIDAMYSGKVGHRVSYKYSNKNDDGKVEM